MLCGVEMYLFDSDYWLTLHWLALFLSGYHADVVPTSQFTVQAVFCLEHGISTFLCVWKLCSKSNHCKMCGNHVIYCFPWSSLVCIQVADVAPKWDMGKEGERDSCMGFVSWRLKLWWRAKGNFDFCCSCGVWGFPTIPAGGQGSEWWDIQVPGLNRAVQWVNAEIRSWIKALGLLVSH